MITIKPILMGSGEITLALEKTMVHNRPMGVIVKNAKTGETIGILDLAQIDWINAEIAKAREVSNG